MDSCERSANESYFSGDIIHYLLFVRQKTNYAFTFIWYKEIISDILGSDNPCSLRIILYNVKKHIYASLVFKYVTFLMLTVFLSFLHNGFAAEYSLRKVEYAFHHFMTKKCHVVVERLK